jgi:hypothetical protein
LRSRPRWLEAGHEYFRSGRLVAEGSVRPCCVVMASPALDDDPGLRERIENLSVEQFVSEPSVDNRKLGMKMKVCWH